MKKLAAALLLALSVVAGLSACGPARPESPGLRAATFTADATIPLGHPVCGGWNTPATRIASPLLIKGVVLDDGRRRVVLAAIDWCVLRTSAYDRLRSAIARGAEVPEDHVALHCTHTHSAPIADARAQEILDGVPGSPAHLDLAFLARTCEGAMGAAANAVFHLEPVAEIGYGKARVEEFASNRRVPGPDGRMRARFSKTTDPALRDAPEGTIDPWLRTVTLFGPDRPLARLHYYATHPQTFYGDGSVHGDVVSDAREYLQNEEGVFQIYFTGCAGDITAGKYNDGSPEAKHRLSTRLYSGLVRAIADTKRAPAGPIDWKVVDVRLPLHPDFTEAAFRKTMEDPTSPPQKRLKAALSLAWIERVTKRPSIDTSRLRLGPVDLVHLPGEAFIAFQLHAQAARPDRFVCVASYGEGGPGYICTDDAHAQGGYEPTAAFVGPPSEQVLRKAIEDLLK